MKRLLLLFVLVLGLNLNAEWTVVETFAIPEGAAGLAWDGEYLYCGIYGVNGDYFYQIDPSDGSSQFIFSVTGLGDCFGLTYDGEHLWTTDHPGTSSNPAIAYELDMNGNILSQFNLPDHYMSGIAYDNSDFWVSTYYDPDGYIYKLDAAGNILQSFAAPDNQPWDLCLENDNLWMADYWGDTLYKINPETGALLESNPSEGVDPSGIVYDGQFLWYCDNGQGTNQDYLYKVDLGGAGMPVIGLGFDEYDFGEVTIGEQATVELPIYNTGAVNLEVTSVECTSGEYSFIFQPPLVVAPDETGFLTIIFEPENWGDFPAVLEIGSNDPIYPFVEVNLNGSGVFADADIAVTPLDLNYGNVRTGAWSGEYIEIANQGTGDLEITSVTSLSADFSIGNEVEFPLTLLTNESVMVRVWFMPSQAITYTSTLEIESNDPDENPVIIDLTGIGENQSFNIGDLVWDYQITTSYDNSPKAIAAIPDINGDFKDDVIICSEDNYIRCFNGNSSDWADVLWENEAGKVYSQQGLVIMEDIDGDDYNDVAAGIAWGGNRICLLSGFDGSEIWSHDTHEYGTGGWVYQVSSGFDYNDDGVNDILAATGNDGNYTGPQRVYCLDALTGDSIWEFYTTGPKFSALGIADVNNDGIPDAIGGGSNQNESDGYVYGINGANGNQMWSYTVDGSSVWALEQLDDINNDGIQDIIAGDFSGNYYGLDASNGSPIWNGSIGTAIILRFVDLGDVNSDGHPDISIAHSSIDNAITLDGYTGTQIWSHPVADQPWNICGIEDLSGDGINDLIVGTLYTNSYVYYLDGTDGSELASVYVGNAIDAIGAIHDVDGNGSMEVIVGARNGWVYCYSGGSVSLGTVEGWVYDNNMNPLEGVMIQVGAYTALTDMQGYFVLQLPPGAYEITITLTGYETSTTAIVVQANETVSVTIILQPNEEILSPQNVQVDNVGLMTWDIPVFRALEHYNIYLDNEYITQTTDFFHQFTGLEFNTSYLAGVSAQYTTGESEIVTVEFVYTGNHTYGDIDDNSIVEAYDASLTLQFVVGIDPAPAAPLPWEEWRITVADVDGNGNVEAYDAALILQYVVGLIDNFPVEGISRFIPEEADVLIEAIDDCLYFSAQGNLLAFELEINSNKEFLQTPEFLAIDAISALNVPEYKFAFASAQYIKGTFLKIPLQRNLDYELPQNISLSLKVNSESQSRIVDLSCLNGNTGQLPEITALFGNMPNPFNPETNISLQIKAGETGILSIYNAKGQLIQEKVFNEGRHYYTWKADNCASGIYFYQLNTNGYSQIRKMLLLK
ncbi:MAG: choice-of-anchor D domain-containing protein [Candidatus Cloacimonetes bacterium]|nr:choice-of-anchor D domain-containing protein [Candidatus Cloacimonadota bacterium]